MIGVEAIENVADHARESIPRAAVATLAIELRRNR